MEGGVEKRHFLQNLHANARKAPDLSQIKNQQIHCQDGLRRKMEGAKRVASTELRLVEEV